MYLTKEKKKEIFKSNSNYAKQTGTPESQIGLFTYRIKHLTGHLKINKKDFNTKRALIRLVMKRKKMLNYIKGKDFSRYQNILKKLNIRK